MTRRLLIKGLVQGVYYRGWSTEQASALGLAGWVRNRRDGSVEMLVHGEPAAVAEMIERCRQGPKSARVDEIQIEETDEPAPVGFETRPTI